MARVHDVAAALLSEMGAMSAMKLEKLAYYSQAWHLARRGQPLFSDRVEAWREGPVVRALYEQHRQQYKVSEWRSGDATRLTGPERETVDWVVRQYGGFSAEELSRLTHSELPWRTARAGLAEGEWSDREITKPAMTSYYGRQQADPEAAVAHAVGSAALEGVTFDAAWQARLREVADGTLSADDLVNEEIARIRRA
jgi:uncharacterized phage-associated protein